MNAWRYAWIGLAACSVAGAAVAAALSGLADLLPEPKSPARSALVVSIPPEMKLEPLPARPPAPPENPTTAAKAALGRLLFFDPILSSAGDVSCATCHSPRFGWADGRSTPVGVGGSGLGPDRVFTAAVRMPALLRNAPSLLNVGFNGLVAGHSIDPESAPMFLDSRVLGLERQLLVPIRTREEMRGDACSEERAVDQAVARVSAIAEYRDLFAKAFDQPPAGAVTSTHLAQAIAAFERALVAAQSPFDRFLRGDSAALTSEQQRGLRVFQQAGCSQCHGGPMLSDFKLHFIGAANGGADSLKEFRTPTLRNLRDTAPYMHNGSLRTVRDVLIFYEALSDAVSETLDGGDGGTQPRLDPLLKKLNLGVEDFPAVEAFLDSLNDEEYDRSEPPKVPSGLELIK